jgi:hypothetical protein
MHSRRATARLGFAAVVGIAALASCAKNTGTTASMSTTAPMTTGGPHDPRVGLKAGMFDAGTALWNMKLTSTTPPSGKFAGSTNSDLAFTNTDVIQGNYNGYQIWDVSNPGQPVLKTSFYCPASQSDVSVYKNLLFVSGEGFSGRLDCGAQGVQDTVSHDRLRGLRIFDITDITNPKYIGNVQTCRGSHTHTVVEDPNDKENVYVYISGSAPVRSPSELAGCSNAMPESDPNSALFRIEVIKVPVAHPEQAAIVSSPRIFEGLTAPKTHGAAPSDIAAQAKAVAEARAKGAYIVTIQGQEIVAPPQFINPMLDSIVKARNGTGAPTAADSAALRQALPAIVAARVAGAGGGGNNANRGPTQCHDITVYPAIGLAGGACGGYGLLLDIHDPANPKRIDAAADSNFSYWHSATFNNDGTKILFSDEWGGGGQPRCRATDKMEWGADAIFTLVNNKMQFKSYYKMPAPQTTLENCVAHNGSLIPIPGRDVMVQSWYQGGVSVFDWTDPSHPKEIAFFDRGPSDSTKQGPGGTWSVYWYNGHMYSSEIARGLDVLELTPSAYITQNEIDAARTVKFDHLNVQGQQKIVWPASFALARAYADQLERSKGLSSSRLSAVRSALSSAESASGSARSTALNALATSLRTDAASSSDRAKVDLLAKAVSDLAGM